MSGKFEENLKLIRDLNPNSLLLFKMGSFYHAYGKDAYLLSYLFGYQIKNSDGVLSTCGFPVSAIGKIESDFDNKKINYMKIVKNDNYAVEEDVSYKIENKYGEFTDKAYKYVAKKKKVDSITSYLLDHIHDERFQQKIIKIEEILYEET